MHINTKILLFITCVLSTEVMSQSETPVNQCIVNYGDMPSKVIIEGCCQQPCKIRKDSTATVHVEFTAPHYIQSATTYATAYVTFLGIPIPLDLGEYKNTCKFIEKTQCPIQGGDFVRLSIEVYVGSSAPIGSVAPVEFFVVDQNKVPLGCVRTEVEIV